MSSGTGGSGSGSCTITQKSSAVSTKIPTVGIVTWSTTLSDIASAKIEFGLTNTYGMTADVDLKETDYRTLLLGMKANKMYHYRITATGPSGSCMGDDQTIMTGALGTSLSKMTITTPGTASALYGGFITTGQYTGGKNAFILDADGDYVWWYTIGTDVTGARMSYDGKYMWINSANVPNAGAHVHRVSMDGMKDDDFTSQFTGQTHHLTVLPDETVAFYAFASTSAQCEDIKLLTPSTKAVKTLANVLTAHGGTGACHVNGIGYSDSDKTIVFSDLNFNAITKIKISDGSTVWVLGGAKGATSTFTGDLWKGGEHGLHVMAADHLLIFNNNSSAMAAVPGTGDGSIAYEMMLDVSGKKVTKTWSYKASPAIQNDIMGDVQRMDNGNTMVCYATKGIIQEVDKDGKLLQQIQNSMSNFGYIEKRRSLYGAPPRQ